MKLFQILRGVAATGAACLTLSQSGLAQGCVMCYTSASALNGHAAHALDKGILVLLIPPALMFIGIFVFIHRRRRGWREAPEPGDSTLDFSSDSAFSAFPAGHPRR